MTAVLALVALCASIAHAHEFKLDTVMNGFVKIEPTEAHVVIRAPLYLFRTERDGTQEPDGALQSLTYCLVRVQGVIGILEDHLQIAAG